MRIVTDQSSAAAPPLAVIVWRDAFFELERGADEPPREDYLVTTVGFVLSEGPTFLTLAQELLPDGEGFRAVTHVPLAIVERVTRLGHDGASRVADAG